VNAWDVVIADEASDADAAALRHALHAFNHAATGYDDGRSLSCIVRDGCTTIVLDTHSFQAPDLYRSRGYVEVGATVETPRGHTQMFFQKAL
jgi:hypothetical protein